MAVVKAVEAVAAPEAAAVEAAAQAEGGEAVGVAATDAEAEEEEVAGDFIFNASGARVGAGHAAASLSDNEEGTAMATAAGASDEPPLKKKRRARSRRILTQAPGMEATAGGEQRIELEAPKRPSMFTASNYFWLYYAAEGVQGLTKKVGINQGSGPHGTAAIGEYHAILSNAVDTDADSISGSNSTYEFAGMHVEQPNLLYVRTYSCACPSCSKPETVNVEYVGCPLISSVGRWRQQPIHATANVNAQRKVQLEDIKTFRGKIKPNKLYAAYASYREELGGRPYWLLLTRSEAKTGKTIKVPGGRTIAKNQWFVEAQWYLSTSDDSGGRRYKLLDGIVHVPPDSFIQEHELQWLHEGRSGGESILHDESHAALMWHNYSNLV